MSCCNRYDATTLQSQPSNRPTLPIGQQPQTISPGTSRTLQVRGIQPSVCSCTRIKPMHLPQSLPFKPQTSLRTVLWSPTSLRLVRVPFRMRAQAYRLRAQSLRRHRLQSPSRRSLVLDRWSSGRIPLKLSHPSRQVPPQVLFLPRGARLSHTCTPCHHRFLQHNPFPPHRHDPYPPPRLLHSPRTLEPSKFLTAGWSWSRSR